MAVCIPKSEYFERIAKFQARIKAAGLDACLVHGTESDFANVRYLSEYWPTFEQAGVFVCHHRYRPHRAGQTAAGYPFFL